MTTPTPWLITMPLPHAALAVAAVLVVASVSFACDWRPLADPVSASSTEAPNARKRHASRTLGLEVRGAPPVRLYPLTTERGDNFTVTPSGERTTVKATKGNLGGNTRLVWVPPKGDVAVDQQVCATWVAWSGLAQPGLALRVRGDGPRVRAVTVTGNIVWGARFGFNVHQWDTSYRVLDRAARDVRRRRRSVGHLRPANGLVSLPWRICARVKGRMLDFKVWAASNARAQWGDTRYGRRFELATSSVYPGRAGLVRRDTSARETAW